MKRTIFTIQGTHIRLATMLADVSSISFSCYLHHQFSNRLRLGAGHYKIPAQQQAVNVCVLNCSLLKQRVNAIQMMEDSYFKEIYERSSSEQNGRHSLEEVREWAFRRRSAGIVCKPHYAALRGNF
jgi:hypothetical protein